MTGLTFSRRTRVSCRLAALPLVTFLVVGCSDVPPESIWIRQGVPASQLQFVIGSKRGEEGVVPFRSLSIERCVHGAGRRDVNQSMWWIFQDSTPRAPNLSRVEYGIPPAGFSTRVPPIKLGPGCYFARLDFSNVLRLDVSKDGAVTSTPH